MTNKKRETTEVRQQQITEAALYVIGQKGISGATTVEIASASGISEGNLYRHFRNKEEIIKSVIDKIGDDLTLILASVAELTDPKDKLETIFKSHLLYLEGHVGIPRTIFSEETIVANDNLRTKVRSTISKYFMGIKEIVEQGQKCGILDEEMDSQSITSMFIGTIHFAVTRWMMNNFSTKLTDETEVLWKCFARGVNRKS
ncbi:TetR/AcrR family transcriptional regulator [Oryzomonas rubra]|uniref:TetR/AcrR family transcriptional regulator n=1 Tax=Oryzomonas rubra TaxID=2509454 RepID=A0A5A9X792_9BACT|nr:TetR/AcrR family transcriptional regulator [Oryzomonas rubra]KAA0888308.1 TetR/AcrR family transcriptional regulator [Oryzomonas rubra]